MRSSVAAVRVEGVETEVAALVSAVKAEARSAVA
jgi:hypothetical protein